MNIAALKVQNLSVWFGKPADHRQVVDKLSFSVEPGEASGLVGESGCGKSVAALAIMGLLPGSRTTVRADRIEINGRDIFKMSDPRRRRILGRDIAMVFQQPGTALDPVFTLGQQISFVYRRHTGSSRKIVRRAVLDSLQRAGFDRPEEIAAAFPHQLSGGMQQLAMIAMATVCKPGVLIADEPTTALDIHSRVLIQQQLRRLQTEHGTAILLISHDLSVIRQSCREVMVMYCGRLLERTDSEKLYAHPRHPYSAGLLSCVPEISSTRPPGIKAIPGQVPRLTELPPGCHFAPRCNRAIPECAQSVPEFQTEAGTDVACFRPL